MGKKLTLEEFIEKARKIHGDKYDYSLVIYINAHTPIIIICPVHGEFPQTPNNHLNSKYGCSKCGGSHKLTQEEFIRKSKLIHGENEYDYSKGVYVDYYTKFLLTHKICNYEFKQKPLDHLQGCKCPRCSNISRIKKNTKYTYQYCLEQTKLYNNIKEWKLCDNCCYEKILRNGWLEELTKHMIKNGSIYKRCIYVYEFDNINDSNYVYVGLTGNLKKRHIQHKVRDSVYKFCKEHNIELSQPKQLSEYIDKEQASILEGEYLQKYKNDGWIPINKHKTGGLGGGLNLKQRTENFFKKVYEVHGDEYDYSKSNYINSHTHIIITHKKCGYEFEQLPSDHLSGRGCPECGKLKKKKNDKVKIHI